MKINNTTVKKTCFIYCRVATHQKTVNSSINIQKKRCLHQARKRHLDIRGIYSEIGMGGMSLSRPKLNQMLKDIKVKHPDYLIVSDIGRICRITSGYYYFKNILMTNKVRIISCDRPSLVNNPTMEAILVALNEYESLQMGKRSQRGIKHGRI